MVLFWGQRKRRFWLSLFLSAVVILALITLNAPRILKYFYPIPHRELIFCYARVFDVDPYLVAAIIQVESRFYPDAESRVGARGLMQLMPETAEWAARQMKLPDYHPSQLYEPQRNIQIGTWYLSELLDEFDHNVVVTVAAYNAGRGNVKTWLAVGLWTGEYQAIDQIPFPETRKYVYRVMSDYYIYRKLYAVK